jgi:hypothetical protein
MNQTAICNLALLRLGIAQPIADITENSVAGRACNAVWEQCIRSMLRERPWSFAVRQVDLALVGQQLFSDWFYTYRYPTDYIVVNRVNPTLTASGATSVALTVDASNLPQTYPFQIGSDASGRLIHTDVDDAVAIGTVYITDTALMDPEFTSALAWYIAAEIAMSLTKNKDMYANAYTEYQRIASDGFAATMNEQKPREMAEANMIQART